MNQCLVSIAMTTYNGEKYLQEQLESILNQSYSNLEIIICDDNSSDNTINIINNYTNKYNNIKVYINNVNLGYVKNFEKAISLCTGDYIALSDQDDVWNEDKIEILLSNIGNNLLIHSDVSLVDEDGKTLSEAWKGEIKSHKCFEDFLFSNVVTGCTVMFAKALQTEALPFPDELAYHDWFLAIHAAKHAKITYLNQPLIQYRQHTTQDTGAVIPNYLSILLLDPLQRLRGKEILRQVGIKKQRKNLLSIQNSIHFSDKEQQNIKDAIAYFSSYLNSFVHIKMFIIGCKYKKYLYPRYNYFCIKNIVRDIIG